MDKLQQDIESATVTVIFRVWEDGYEDTDPVFALFPEQQEPGGMCDCYQHMGGHCSADYRFCIAMSRPATPEEYADLASELRTHYGYILRIRQRYNRRRASHA